MNPFGVISDLHFHNWSAFSSVDKNGLNSRLIRLTQQVARAAVAVKNAGGRHLFITGDVFHVRGSVAPSVLNPVLDVFEALCNQFEVHILPGNHDLEGKDASIIGSAVTSLMKVGCNVIGTEPETINSEVRMLPWYESLDELKTQMQDSVGKADYLMIHAPMNGVIRGLPETGLDPAWVASLGFKGVFSGHYHNHVAFPDDVYSVGAIAHHTWSDVGSKAGFLVVDPAMHNVHWVESTCPKFVELTPEMDIDEMKRLSDGNYVKVRIASSSMEDVAEIRLLLEASGALGVTVIAEPKSSSVARSSTSVSTGLTIEQNVASFVDRAGYSKPDAVKDAALSVLTAVQAVA